MGLYWPPSVVPEFSHKQERLLFTSIIFYFQRQRAVFVLSRQASRRQLDSRLHPNAGFVTHQRPSFP